ncbi:hypothetical protein [Streptomyces silvensis]|uniref:Uncharacterized protein n=1 Tax=Streptomyces silvensis TaxID=1765722 RepID=A0A0W7X8H1_9ACTN|nr:hypothetical protein [Streptomyces silvensis]KUF18851.1 hypothetical protein AT728_07400 [Streptomyces silvensis]
MKPRTVEEERASIHLELDRMYEGYDGLSEMLDDLLRAHAHELAEKIRAICHGAYDPGAPGVDQVGGMVAADLIDPEVIR